VWLFGLNDLAVITYGLAGFLWVYTSCIMVRERDEDRFREHSLSFSGT
jgi:hypothetical protein